MTFYCSGYCSTGAKSTRRLLQRHPQRQHLLQRRPQQHHPLQRCRRLHCRRRPLYDRLRPRCHPWS
jgi:hypothetical protein